MFLTRSVCSLHKVISTRRSPFSREGETFFYRSFQAVVRLTLVPGTLNTSSPWWAHRDWFIFALWLQNSKPLLHQPKVYLPKRRK